MITNKHRIIILKEKVEKLNQVSPTFCLAKWKQTTTTLYNGMTHSCHHPVQHKIKIDDIINDPRGLHNTPTKFAARQDMLNGIQTKECDYCWNIENLDTEHFSDRHHKSAFEDTWESFDEVVASGIGENINPSYLEIAFENICNFKCSYCSPDVSSRWMEEIQSNGAYQLKNYSHHNLEWLKQSGRFPIHHKEYNPYIEAFWKWWPELYPNLKTFRITGGEPLLSDNTWKVIDYINNNPKKDLTFAINTNLNVPDKLIDKLILEINKLQPKIKEIQIFTSAEAIGAQQEYSRYGMNWEIFSSNCIKLLDKTPDEISFKVMTAINLFSVSTFDKFLYWLIDLRKKYNKVASHNRVGFFVSYIRWPRFLSLLNLSIKEKLEFTKRINDCIQNINDNNPSGHRFYLEEIDMLNRLTDFINSIDNDQNIEIQNFSLFVDEYDKRRGTNFFNTFPELINLYNRGKQIVTI